MANRPTIRRVTHSVLGLRQTPRNNGVPIGCMEKCSAIYTHIFRDCLRNNGRWCWRSLTSFSGSLLDPEVPLQQHQCFIWCSEFLGKLKALKHLKVRFVRWEYWWFVPRFVPWFGTPPGHGAIEVTLPNGQVYYFDDWWWVYIFQPPDIPVYVNPK